MPRSLRCADNSRLGEARSAQADLAEARAERLRGEVAPVAEVEAKWTAACRSIRARVLAVADKMRDLPARQHVKLATALRAALTDLADGNAPPSLAPSSTYARRLSRRCPPG